MPFRHNPTAVLAHFQKQRPESSEASWTDFGSHPDRFEAILEDFSGGIFVTFFAKMGFQNQALSGGPRWAILGLPRKTRDSVVHPTPVSGLPFGAHFEPFLFMDTFLEDLIKALGTWLGSSWRISWTA